MFSKRFRYIPLLLLLALACLVSSGCAQQRRPAATVKKIVLRDDAGTERARLVIGEGQVQLSVHDAKGRTLFDLNFSEAGLHVEVVDEAGETHSATLTAEPVE